MIPGFTAKYNVVKLVYYETFEDPESAMRREKQIKGGFQEKEESVLVTRSKQRMERSIRSNMRLLRRCTPRNDRSYRSFTLTLTLSTHTKDFP